MNDFVEILRAAGETTRMRILALLRQGDLSVGELVQVLGQSQPRLSHHLKVLAGAGLVERLPEGSWVFYRLATAGKAGGFLDHAFTQIRQDDATLARDARALEGIRQARAREAEAYFSRIAESWDAERALHFPDQAIEEAMLSVVGQGPFDHVIDLGTGTGRMLTLFSPHATCAEGLDLSHGMLTVARSNLERAGIRNARVRQGDAGATPFATGCADLVILHQVLHFIEVPARVLSEADRLLRPGGQFVIVDFAPHELEFLRRDHGHRRLGLHDEALRDWAAGTTLDIRTLKRFDPPGGAGEQGLAVQIWAARKPTLAQEVAA